MNCGFWIAECGFWKALARWRWERWRLFYEWWEGALLVLLEVEKRNEDEGVVFGDEAGSGLEGDIAEDVEERDLVEF